MQASDVHLTDDTGADRCLCPPGEFSADCPWARAFPPGAPPLGHVRACPVSGDPCPCLPGSTAHAYCTVDAHGGPHA